MDNTVVNNVDNAATACERKVEMISTSTPSAFVFVFLYNFILRR